MASSQGEAIGMGKRGSTFGLVPSHIIPVLGVNWLLAGGAAPAAWLVAWALTSRYLVSHAFAAAAVIAFILVEVAGYFVEVSWSGVALWRFWILAAPICCIQAAVALHLCRYDALGTLAASVLLLGLREAVFEALQASRRVGGWGGKERLVLAFVGGSVYSGALALLCMATAFLIHLSQGRGHPLSSPMFNATIVVIVPAGRCAAKAAFARWTGGVDKVFGRAGGALTPSTGGSPLDTVVLRGDAAFAMAVLLDFPYVLILFLLSSTSLFYASLIMNTALDVCLVFALDAFQARRKRCGPGGLDGAEAAEDGLGGRLTPRLGLGAAPGAPRRAAGAAASPSYCLERPATAIAALLSSGESLGASPDGTVAYVSTPVTSPRPSMGLAAATAAVRRVSGYGATSSDSESDFSARGAAPPPFGHSGGGDMSPRVSRLLDEFDGAVIRRRRLAAATAGDSGGEPEGSIERGVHMLQELKWISLANASGSAAAIAGVLAVMPLVQHRLLWFNPSALGWRIAAIIIARCIVDLVGCEIISAVWDPLGETRIWQSRYELASSKGWLFRAAIVAAAAGIAIAGMH